MATLSNITVTKELRLCKIDGELGYFHCWEQYGDIIFPGIMVGSNPGGQYSRIFGIVEFDDRIERVDPTTDSRYRMPTEGTEMRLLSCSNGVAYYMEFLKKNEDAIDN